MSKTAIQGGLIVIPRSQCDSYILQQWLTESDYHADFDFNTGSFTFPEYEENYDQLEAELSKVFDGLNIDVRFEGIF